MANPTRPVLRALLWLAGSLAFTLGCLLVLYYPAPTLLLGDGLAVQVYDAGTWRTYTRADGVRVRSVVAMATDGLNQVWLAGGAFGGGVSCYRRASQQWVHYSRRQGDALYSDWVRDLAADGRAVWVATAVGVTRFEGTLGVAYSIHDGRRMSTVLKEICAGDDACIYKARNGGLPAQAVAAVAAGDGHLWAAADDGSLSHYDGAGWSLMSPRQVLGSNPRQGLRSIDSPITALALAGDVLWVGTGAQGVLRYDGRAWQRYGTADGLPDLHVRDLAVFGGRVWALTAEGAVWADAETGGAFKVEPCLAPLTHGPGAVAGNERYAYFATGIGLVAFDQHAGRCVTYGRPQGLASDTCLSVAVDQAGRVWVAITPSPWLPLMGGGLLLSLLGVGLLLLPLTSRWWGRFLDQCVLDWTRVLTERTSYTWAARVAHVGLALHPRSPTILLALSVIYHQQGRLEEAAQLGRRVVELAPQAPVAHSNLGGVLAALGRHEEAEAECRRALELPGATPGAYNNLAWSLILRGEDLQGAVELLQTGLERSISRLHRSMCTATLSQAYLRLGRVEEALQMAEEALRLANRADRPQLAMLYHVLGSIQRAAGTEEKARESFEQVIRLDPHGRYAEPAAQALRELAGSAEE